VVSDDFVGFVLSQWLTQLIGWDEFSSVELELVPTAAKPTPDNGSSFSTGVG